jgi:hypothetical protein
MQLFKIIANTLIVLAGICLGFIALRQNAQLASGEQF